MSPAAITDLCYSLALGLGLVMVACAALLWLLPAPSATRRRRQARTASGGRVMRFWMANDDSDDETAA